MRQREDSECKETGIEWVERIPKEWKLRRLRLSCQINPRGQKHVSDDMQIVSFLPMERVSSIGKIDHESTASYGEVSSAYTYFQNKDVIIAKITPCFENRKGALVDNLINGFGFGTTEFHVLRAGDKIDPGFLYYFTYSHLFRNIGEAFMQGAAGQKRVPTDFVKDFLMPTPPRNEQENISRFLNKKNTEINSLVSKNEQLTELLKKKRTAIINQAVTRGLDPEIELKDSGIEWIGKVPDGWSAVPLKKYLESIVDYRGATPEKTLEGTFLVTGRNVKSGKIDYEISKEYVSTDEYDKIMHRGKPQVGDLLFTTEAPLGEVANVDREDIALAQRIIKMRGKKGKLDNFYLKYYIMSALFQAHLQSQATGSTALGIKASNMCYLRLIIPTFNEQRSIVNYLDTKVNEIDTSIEKVENRIQLLEEYRKSLINSVVTGEIDVRKHSGAS